VVALLQANDESHAATPGACPTHHPYIHLQHSGALTAAILGTKARHSDQHIHMPSTLRYLVPAVNTCISIGPPMIPCTSISSSQGHHWQGPESQQPTTQRRCKGAAKALVQRRLTARQDSDEIKTRAGCQSTMPSAQNLMLQKQHPSATSLLGIPSLRPVHTRCASRRFFKHLRHHSSNQH
jgi:hypothetical protein